MIMRLLMMFGPMLFRMYKKFQKKQAIQKEETSYMDHSQESNGNPEYQESTQSQRQYSDKDFV